MTTSSDALPSFPRGWIWTKLGEIAEVIRGASPRPKGDPRYFGGTIPWIMISDISKEEGKFISKTRDTVTEEGARKSRLLKAGTLILSNSGTVCVPKILAIDGCIHDGFVAFPDLTKSLEMLYLYYYFDFIRPRIIQENRQGVTQVNLNTNIVRNMDVPLPPLAEQGRIVGRVDELFSSLDAGVESLRKVKAQLKRYRQGVLKYAFEGKLTEEWRKTHKDQIEPAQLLPERLREEFRKDATVKVKKLLPVNTSDLLELPELWIWTKLGEIVEVIRGASPRPKGDPRYFGGNIPWIMISDISNQDGKYISKTRDTVTVEGAKKSRYLKAGTLILSNSATVCVPKILAVDGCIHDGFVAFPNLTGNLDIFYLYYYFDYIRPRIIQENRQGVTQVNLNTDIVRNILISLPPPAEQHKVVEEIERRFSLADEIEKAVERSLKQAKRLRQAILKRAFEGKLVPQGLGDEPAEELLERIKIEKPDMKLKSRLRRKVVQHI